MNRLFFIVLLLIPLYAQAACNPELALYDRFKTYRETLNQAQRFEQLSVFFTQSFKYYYESKIDNAVSESEKQRYLNQYWDNLRIAKDIIIVYEHEVICDQPDPKLQLTAVLDDPSNKNKSRVDLWEITIYYKEENNHWLIHQFEYEKSQSNKLWPESSIKDNFVILR